METGPRCFRSATLLCGDKDFVPSTFLRQARTHQFAKAVLGTKSLSPHKRVADRKHRGPVSIGYRPGRSVAEDLQTDGHLPPTNRSEESLLPGQSANQAVSQINHSSGISGRRLVGGDKVAVVSGATGGGEVGWRGREPEPRFSKENKRLSRKGDGEREIGRDLSASGPCAWAL